MMHEYQNADYRSIYNSDPFDVPTVGRCWLVIFIEDVQECDDVPDSDRWWTVLFLVSPTMAGPEKVQGALDFIGWQGERRPPTETDEAVALAEAGNRLVLWERQTGDWEPDLEEAQREAERFLADPGRLRPFLRAVTFERTGYDHLR